MTRIWLPVLPETCTRLRTRVCDVSAQLFCDCAPSQCQLSLPCLPPHSPRFSHSGQPSTSRARYPASHTFTRSLHPGCPFLSFSSNKDPRILQVQLHGNSKSTSQLTMPSWKYCLFFCNFYSPFRLELGHHLSWNIFLDAPR